MVDVEALYRKYGPMVLRRCRHLLGDEERALDAMQECFVRVLKNRERLSDEAPSSLLYCIATNVCLNIMRAERKPTSGTRALGGEDLLESLVSRDDVEGLGLARHLVDRLFRDEAPSTRTMAVLHYVDGLSLEETAAACHISVSGLRKRLSSLRKRSLELEGEGK